MQISTKDYQPTKILLVDDEPQVIAALKRILAPHPFDITTAKSANEALEHLEQNSFQLLMTDFRMAECTGVQLCEIVGKKYPQTVRIMMSGNIDQPKVQAMADANIVFDFLLKPWDEQDLFISLESAIEEWSIRRERKELLEKMEKYEREEERLQERAKEKVRGRSERIKLSKKVFQHKQQELRFVSQVLTTLSSGGDIIELMRDYFSADELLVLKEEHSFSEPQLSEDCSTIIFPLTPEVMLNFKRSSDPFTKKDLDTINENSNVIQASISYALIQEDAESGDGEWDATFNAIPDPMLFSDSTGSITDINLAAENLVKLPREKIIGKKIDLLRRTWGNKKGFKNRRFLIRDGSGSKSKILESIKDQREEYKLTNKLIKSEQEIALNNLTQNMLKEIAEPLERVKQFADLMLEDLSEEDDLKNQIQTIQSECEQSLAMLEGIDSATPEVTICHSRSNYSFS